MSDSELRDFPTYGALSRAAMIFGVPLMALVAVFVGSLVVIMGLSQFEAIGSWSYLFVLVSLAILLIIKSVCALDDQAMRILSFEILWFIKKTNKAIWGNNLVLLPIKYGRCENEIKRFYQSFI
jgi:type IV secretion system protein VirB3